MLRYLKGVCEQNDIKYYLAYGTLIGAIREQGFIPWDEDIDIHIRFDDADRLRDIVNSENGRYRILSFKDDEEYYTRPYRLVDTYTIMHNEYIRGEIAHLYIDIYQLGGVSESEALF